MSLYSRNITKSYKAPGHTGSKSFNSYTELDRVYTGQYFDEMTIPSLYVQEGKELHILGSGLGSCVRPCLGSRSFAKLELVDLSEDMTRNCDIIFSKYFPSIRENIDFHTTNSFSYLDSVESMDGLVIIDIFDAKGHAIELGQLNFYDKLFTKMSQNSVGIINVSSYPIFLGPNRQLSFVLNKIKRLFKYFNIIPYRTNTSILFSQSPFTFNARNNNGLDAVDTAFCETLSLRAKLYASCANKVSNLMHLKNSSSEVLTFKEIKSDFSLKYLSLQKEFNKSNINLDDITSDSIECVKTYRNLLDYCKINNNDYIQLLPLTVKAASCTSKKIETTYYAYKYYINRIEFFKKKLDSVLYGYFISQISSLAVNLYENNKDLTYELQKIVREGSYEFF